MNQDKIGNFIKSIRLDNNLTQKEFADKFGVTYQAVSKWENGKNIPDLAIIKQICDEYNIDIDEILNGKKKSKRKKLIILIPIFIILVVAIIILLSNKDRDFEFKTISSKCSDFKITGSAAYNKDKTSIYISNIEFCGTEDNEKYTKITCDLYENRDDTRRKISSCKEEKNIKLSDYLKETKINVNKYTTSCKTLTSNSLFLEIKAINKENKTITYTIPIKLNDSCKQGK